MLILTATTTVTNPTLNSWVFWLPTITLIVTIVIATYTLWVNEQRARKRTTVDLVLAENQDAKFRETKETFALMRQNGENFTALALDNSGQSISEDERKQLADKKEVLIAILNQYEFIASAIFEDCLDEKLYKRMKKGVFLRDWNALKPFVMELRRVHDRDKLFCEMEKLADKWKNEPNL